MRNITYEQMRKKAEEMGARVGTIRQWKHLGEVPPGWQVKLALAFRTTPAAINASVANAEDRAA